MIRNFYKSTSDLELLVNDTFGKRKGESVNSDSLILCMIIKHATLLMVLILKTCRGSPKNRTSVSIGQLTSAIDWGECNAVRILPVCMCNEHG